MDSLTNTKRIWMMKFDPSKKVSLVLWNAKAHIRGFQAVKVVTLLGRHQPGIIIVEAVIVTFPLFTWAPFLDVVEY